MTTQKRMSPEPLVEYRRLELRDGQDVDQDFVALEREAFAGPPWNEHVRCSACYKKHGIQEGLKPGDACPDCAGTALELCWSDAAIKAGPKDNSLRANASCHLAYADDVLVGFIYACKRSMADIIQAIK